MRKARLQENAADGPRRDLLSAQSNVTSGNESERRSIYSGSKMNVKSVGSGDFREADNSRGCGKYPTLVLEFWDRLARRRFEERSNDPQEFLPLIGGTTHTTTRSRSTRLGNVELASREKLRLSTDHWTGVLGIIQYRRISPPDPQVFAGLDYCNRQTMLRFAKKLGGAPRCSASYL